MVVEMEMDADVEILTKRVEMAEMAAKSKIQRVNQTVSFAKRLATNKNVVIDVLPKIPHVSIKMGLIFSPNLPKNLHLSNPMKTLRAVLHPFPLNLLFFTNRLNESSH